MKELTGKVFNVQRCSIHDGRGMRTTVFFKGCGLRCVWCANPESIAFNPELSLNVNNCMGCKFCVKHCSAGAVYLNEQEAIEFDRDRCTGCGTCAKLCPTDARKLFGEDYTVDELFSRVYQDRFYFEHSGGGITFSGGEPLLQPEFLLGICKKLKEYGINVAVESCGFADYEKFKPCLDYIDYIFYDLKQMNPEIHKEITGQGNKRILDNLRKISGHGIEICVRTPVIPGFNDCEENIHDTARFVSKLSSVRKYELLAYHKLGINKYRIMGREYKLEEVAEPTADQMFRLADIANEVLEPAGKKCFYNKDNIADE